jgi:hypothetical protein
MSASRYRGRRACSIENQSLRVTVVAEGGHIAEFLDKRTGINPLWSPKWESIDPSSLDHGPRRLLRRPADAPLLAGHPGAQPVPGSVRRPVGRRARRRPHDARRVLRVAVSPRGGWATLTAHATFPLANLSSCGASSFATPPCSSPKQ